MADDARKQLRDKLVNDANAREKFFTSFKEAVRATGLNADDPKVMKELGFNTMEPKSVDFARTLDTSIIVTINH
ncbi:MAG TPA: hypothetical protein VF744_07800 [Beijerinckiaceae bacterium]|jgi:hypothetical protein